MTTIRAKDLPLASPPVGTDSVEVDSTSGGTRRSLVSELRDAIALQAVALSATPPTAGQVLTAGSPTAAAWADAAGGGFSASDATSAFFDDFTDPALPGWLLKSTTGGSLSHVGNVAPFGFPGSGAVIAEVNGTSGAEQKLTRMTGLAFDALTPIVMEWRHVVSIAAGAASDDECEWVGGIVSAASPEDAVALIAVWSGGARTYALVVINAGAVTDTPVTLPPLGGGTGYRFRLTASPADAQIECAVDDGALVVLATLAQAPTERVYYPALGLSRGSGAGSRSLVVDYVGATAARYASSVGAALGTEGAPVVQPPTSATAPLTLSAGVLAISAATTSAAGSMSAADKTKLDGVAAGATVAPALSSTTPAAVGTAAIGVGTTTARADHVHAHGNQAAGATLHAAASDTVAGFVELATSAETITGTDAARAVTPAGAEALHAYRRTSGTVAAPVTGAFNFATYPSGSTIFISTAGGVATGTLPACAAGLHWRVKDIGGALSTNALTVVRTGSENIEGVAASYIFGANFGALDITADGTDWWI